MEKTIKKLLVLFSICTGILMIVACSSAIFVDPITLASFPPATMPAGLFGYIPLTWSASLIGTLMIMSKSNKQHMLQCVAVFVLYFALMFLMSLVALFTWCVIAFGENFWGAFIVFFSTGAIIRMNITELLEMFFPCTSVCWVFAIVLQLVLLQPKIKHKKLLGTVLGTISVVLVLALESGLYTLLKAAAFVQSRRSYEFLVALIVLSVCGIAQFALNKKKRIQ